MVAVPVACAAAGLQGVASRPARETGRGAGRKDAAQLDRELDDYYGNQVRIMRPAQLKNSGMTPMFLLAALTEALSCHLLRHGNHA